jgi:sec-independent protein translocase protein TatC
MTQAIEHEQQEELDGQMSFLDHLAELRRRIVYGLIAILVGFGICWFWITDIFHLLLLPLTIAAPEMDLAQMHHKDLAEPFFTLLKLGIVCGIFVGSPVLLYNIWKFIAPGLYPNERKVVVPFVVLATFFFFLGASFCYFIVIPFGYRFLLDFSMQVSQPTLMMNEYFSLTMKLLLGFGIVFEMPVVAMFLSAVGIITHRTLLYHWRIAVVGAFIIAAMLTPPDVVTQAMMAGPLLILYGISVCVAWVFTRRREKKQAAFEASLEA